MRIGVSMAEPGERTVELAALLQEIRGGSGKVRHIPRAALRVMA